MVSIEARNDGGDAGETPCDATGDASQVEKM